MASDYSVVRRATGVKTGSAGRRPSDGRATRSGLSLYPLNAKIKPDHGSDEPYYWHKYHLA